MYRELLINKITPYKSLGHKKLETGVELFGFGRMGCSKNSFIPKNFYK